MWLLTVRFQISKRTPRLPGVFSCGLTYSASNRVRLTLFDAQQPHLWWGH